MSAFTRTARREVLARSIADMRPTIDNVHEAMLEATQFGVTYASLASATGTNETRAQRWSAGADIPESVGERRAILSTLARLLAEMPGAPDRRRKTIEGRHESRTERNERCARASAAILSLRAAGQLLCAHCMRNRNKSDVVCTSRNCRNKVKA